MAPRSVIHKLSEHGELYHAACTLEEGLLIDRKVQRSLLDVVQRCRVEIKGACLIRLVVLVW